MNNDEIKKELLFFPEWTEEKLTNELKNRTLFDIFNEHCQKYSEEVKAIDIIENFQETNFLIDTPDGYQKIGDFYIKHKRNIHQINVNKCKSIKVSSDHKIETNEGWKMTKHIKNGDQVLTKFGFQPVLENEIVSNENVYDWEVLHENHRYWCDEISSHNTGKTFLTLNICREAQKKDYNIIYCDSEAAVDLVQFEKFGLNPEKVRYQPINTPLEFKFFVSNLLKQLKDAKAAGSNVPKIMLVLDSLGNLATTKERNDAVSGSEKKDMTKQQELRSLFRVITMDLAEAKIPFVMTAHTYQCISGENTVLMNDGTYKNIKDIKKGEFVITMDGEKEIVDTFEYNINEYIELEFEDGYILKCTPGHKLAINDNGNIIWKCVDDLKENDIILID